MDEAVTLALVENSLAKNHLSTQISEGTNGGNILHIYNRYNSSSRLIVLLVTLVFLTQCAPLTHKQEMVPNRPMIKVLPARPHVVREAAERVLIQKKFSLDTERSNTLHLQTEWLKEKNYRSMAKVDLKPYSKSKTKVTLNVLMQKKIFFKEEWRSTDKIGEDTYRILMGDIEMEIYRVLYDGP